MLALRIKKAVRKGATLVVADPRKIWLTKLAKRHLQLRPGTDVWLLNAMMHTILEEGLQNEEYIRETTDDFEAVREIVMRYPPEEAEKITGVPAEDIRATAREYASERHAGIFYTLGITEHACGVDNIWSLSNLVLMTGHLGYESTGLNALRGQNNVQGLNDSGANPSYLPGYQSVDDPEIRRKFSEAWGVEVPERPGYRLDQIDLRPPRRADQGALPHRREPGADRAERASRRGGPRRPRLPDVAGHLPQRLVAEVRATSSFRPPASPRRTARSRTPSGGSAASEPAAPLPGEAQGRPRDRHRAWRRRSARTGPSTPTRSPSGTSSPTSRRTGTASATTGSRRTACSGRAPTSTIPGRRTCTPRSRRCRAVAAASSRSSSSRPIEEPDSEYPFVLTTGRTLYHYNSANMTMREPGVTDKQEAPFFEIHAHDAGALGIADREVARLVSRRGELEAEAHYSERVYPGLVWMALHFADQKVNWLTHDVGDPLIGTPEYKVSAVRVERR